MASLTACLVFIQAESAKLTFCLTILDQSTTNSLKWCQSLEWNYFVSYRNVVKFVSSSATLARYQQLD